MFIVPIIFTFCSRKFVVPELGAVISTTDCVVPLTLSFASFLNVCNVNEFVVTLPTK